MGSKTVRGDRTEAKKIRRIKQGAPNRPDALKIKVGRKEVDSKERMATYSKQRKIGKTQGERGKGGILVGYRK